VTNTLAYYTMELITDVKSFQVHGTVTNAIPYYSTEPITVVKSFQVYSTVTNTLAYYTVELITAKKGFKCMAQWKTLKLTTVRIKYCCKSFYEEHSDQHSRLLQYKLNTVVKGF